MIELELPMPPSVNKLYANVRGRRIMTSKGKTVKHEIRQAATKQVAGKPSLFTQEVPLRLTVDLYFSAIVNKGWPSKAKNRYKRIDVSNRAKLLEDALFSVLGIDDSLIFELIMRKHATDGKEYCRVILEHYYEQDGNATDVPTSGFTNTQEDAIRGTTVKPSNNSDT